MRARSIFATLGGMTAWLKAGLAAAALLAAAPLPAGETPIFPAVVALTPKQIRALKDALGADPGAARAFEPMKIIAGRALTEKPDPVKRIVSEGRLYSDAEKKRSLQARRDLAKIEALGYAYALLDKKEYGEKARDFVLAWARVYEPEGNPINETEFVRLMKGYDLARALFTESQRLETNRWLSRLAEKEKTAVDPASTAAKNNHYSHRLKIIGHAAFLLADRELIRWTAAEYRRHLNVNLYPDGTTFDLRQRDALHYHVYDLEPLVELALAAAGNGEDFYGYATPQGGSLDQSIAFLIPYITGEKTHREFVHSTIKFDRERSAAGDPSIRVGAPWDPAKARTLFDLAGYFDPRFHAVKFPGGNETPSFDRLLATLR